MASSIKAIESLIRYTNDERGFGDRKLWNKDPDTGRNVAAVGMLYLYRCLGVWAVHQMANDGGGVHTILSAPTGRELENQLRAFRRGLHFNN